MEHERFPEDYEADVPDVDRDHAIDEECGEHDDVNEYLLDDPDEDCAEDRGDSEPDDIEEFREVNCSEECAERELPPEIARTLPTRWCGPGLVPACRVERANDVWSELIADAINLSPLDERSLGELAGFAVMDLEGEVQLTIDALDAAVRERARARADERGRGQRRGTNKGTLAPLSSDSPWEARRKRLARERMSARRRKWKDDVRNWIGGHPGDACAGCGQPGAAGNLLELNCKGGGGEGLRRTPNGKRDADGEWKYAWRLGRARCREKFDFRHRHCHEGYDRERLRAGGRKGGMVSGKVRRARQDGKVRSEFMRVVSMMKSMPLERRERLLREVVSSATDGLPEGTIDGSASARTDGLRAD